MLGMILMSLVVVAAQQQHPANVRSRIFKATESDGTHKGGSDFASGG
jgi:hypothetical protein